MTLHNAQVTTHMSMKQEMRQTNCYKHEKVVLWNENNDDIPKQQAKGENLTTMGWNETKKVQKVCFRRENGICKTQRKKKESWRWAGEQRERCTILVPRVQWPKLNIQSQGSPQQEELEQWKRSQRKRLSKKVVPPSHEQLREEPWFFMNF